MADVVSTNELKNGMHIELEGGTWRIIEFQHVKPGKGGAFVRTKLKSTDSGSVVDKTFRAGEKFARVRTDLKNVQYLYDAGDHVVFMDEQNYEQIQLPRELVADADAAELGEALSAPRRGRCARALLRRSRGPCEPTGRAAPRGTPRA